MPKRQVVRDFSFDMHTFFGMLLADRRPRRRRSAATTTPRRARPSERQSTPRVRARSDDGFLLVEVIVSALLVALIVVGTLNGFDAASRTGVDERNHDEAAVLASESQEALRSDPASVLGNSGKLFEHSYTRTVNGTTFTVTQTAHTLNGSSESTACSATNTSRQETNSLRMTSSVTWAQLKAAGRPAVKESGTITPPAGSTLEVDVGNYPTPTAGVSGVTAIAKYTPESQPQSTVQGTTEAPGCVVFTSLPVTAATVEVQEKSGFVTPSGSWLVEPKEVAIAPNYTTHYAVTLNEGGAIAATFKYKGQSEYKHANNSGVANTVTEPVQSTTFVAFNEGMGSPPDFELGDGGKGTFSTGTYKVEPNTYGATATTPKETVKYYPNGNLFPFASTESPWKAYAGACTANDPQKLGATTTSGTVTDPTAIVLGAKTTEATVPVAYMRLNVYTGKQSTTPKTYQETTAFPVTITDTACKNITPNNETEFNEPRSEQKQTVSSSLPGWGGHLEDPFLPFGAGKLCLAFNSGTKHYTFTDSYELKAEEEYERNIYLEQLPTSPSTSSEYNENVKRLPSGTTENAITKVVKSSSGEAKC
jgi:Tfp pilus assembly protein PilV